MLGVSVLLQSEKCVSIILFLVWNENHQTVQMANREFKKIELSEHVLDSNFIFFKYFFFVSFLTVMMVYVCSYKDNKSIKPVLIVLLVKKDRNLIFHLCLGLICTF